MYFTKDPNPTFRKCYSTERPYFEKNSNKGENFVPTVLADLTQIVDYCKKNKYSESGEYHIKLSEEKQIEICSNVKALCANQNIIGNENESKWDNYVDQQIKVLEDHYHNQQQPNEVSRLAYEQISSASKIIKKVMYIENEAHLNDQFLFWRVSNKGHEADILNNLNQTHKVSYGDSLFSGYIEDGMFHSNIAVSFERYSACVYSYYQIHKQGRKIVSDGQYDGVPISKMPAHYQTYFNKLGNHELYALKFDTKEITDHIKYQTIFIPDNTISSAACYQGGEEFHPAIRFSGDNTKYESMINCSYLDEF